MENYDSLLKNVCSKIKDPKPLVDKVDLTGNYSSDWYSVRRSKRFCSRSILFETYEAYTTEEKLLKLLSTTEKIKQPQAWLYYHAEDLFSLLKSIVGPQKVIDQITKFELEESICTLSKYVRIQFKTQEHLRP